MESVKIQLPAELQTLIVQTVKETLNSLVKASEKENDFPPYMNQKQASMYLHIAPATLIKWEKTYSSFPVIIVDGTERYKKSSLDGWMKQKEK
ncbi:DNA-binding protein [Lactobacillus intestinalis]|uniref:DNA-binding protein n=1 Tax=Lactobacillus intestinalis TaxID=151781 RepID=UPI0025A993FF|nr:DNA-binding protein [Lactobacillus intestinalis]